MFSIFVSELFQDLSQMQETWLAEGKPLTSMLGKGRTRYKLLSCSLVLVLLLFARV